VDLGCIGGKGSVYLKKVLARFHYTLVLVIALFALLSNIGSLSYVFVGFYWSNKTSSVMVKQMLANARKQQGVLIPGDHLECAVSRNQAAETIEEWQSSGTVSHSAIIVPYAWHCGTPGLAQQTIDWINANRPTADTLADTWVRYYQGDVFYTQGKLDQAIEAWRGVPNSGWFFASLGSGLYDKDRAAALQY